MYNGIALIELKNVKHGILVCINHLFFLYAGSLRFIKFV